MRFYNFGQNKLISVLDYVKWEILQEAEATRNMFKNAAKQIRLLALICW